MGEEWKEITHWSWFFKIGGRKIEANLDAKL